MGWHGRAGVAGTGNTGAAGEMCGAFFSQSFSHLPWVFNFGC